MNDTANDLAVILFYFGLSVAAYIWVRSAFKRRSVDGHIRLKNGRTYSYTVGDDLSWGYLEEWHYFRRRLRAIDVLLPKEMPHIYLDSLVGGGRSSLFVIDPKQCLQLEGNFNKYFRVFVPKRYEVEALSILSPDVMQTMIAVAGEYDLEIYGSHLRVISRRTLFKHPDRQRQIIAIATKILEELDHRLQSWSLESSRDAHKQDLRIFPVRGIRIGGRFYKLQFIMLEFVWLLVSLALWWAALAVKDYSAAGLALLALAPTFFVIMTVITVVGTRHSAVRSRRG